MTHTLPGFHAATGDESPSDQSPDARAAAVHQALAGLRQIRALMNPQAGRSVSVPAEWERLRPVRAIALALEAARIPASVVAADGRRTATGYRVSRDEGAVRVEWLGPPGSGAVYEQHEQLQRCARALRDLGWQTLEYRGARRHRWLEVEAPP
ncbi:hypothetical protein LRS74_01820 [Streptomyces sp. LX-29]|uniref:hypothetical protein n=1 Tax=Streptomyces sp. LX-29 TaxID=2900152 RepID=UPI00240D0FE4|nr:hypothetical protein [Streptomyces sp. LX-29]WFB05904.1 hypothetical protein LRS74_01820 [Streptomyces sp. LX-29]